MAKYKKQEMPDLDGSGKKRTYFRFDVHRNIGEDDFFTWLKRFDPTISKGAYESVMSAIAATMSRTMSEGYSVTLKGIGTFTPKIGQKKKKNEDNNSIVPEKSIERNYVQSPGVIGINYRASKKLIKATDKESKFENGGTINLHKSRYTLEERIARAKAYMAGNGNRMHVYEYASLNGLSHTTAARELRRLAKTEGSGISKEGSGAHVIYVVK